MLQIVCVSRSQIVEQDDRGTRRGEELHAEADGLVASASRPTDDADVVYLASENRSLAAAHEPARADLKITLGDIDLRLTPRVLKEPEQYPPRCRCEDAGIDQREKRAPICR